MTANAPETTDLDLDDLSIVNQSEAAAACRMIIRAYRTDVRQIDEKDLFAAMNWARSALGLKPIFRAG